MDKHIQIIVDWLRQQVRESHTNGLIVGLSGGVDSALIAFLIKRAFPNDSLAVIMPCHSDPQDVEDAIKTAEACGIDSQIVDISDTHETLLKTVQSGLTEKKQQRADISQLVDGNLRARLRMSTLYTIANHYNYLVVGTDNAAEWYTGYFTKYGDGGVDLLPIVHLLKRDVYTWAKHLGVPQSVLDRAPSAGLWEGQDDETEMGITYDKIDDFLSGKPIPEVDRDKVENMHRRTAHKRSTPQIPAKF